MFDCPRISLHKLNIFEITLNASKELLIWVFQPFSNFNESLLNIEVLFLNGLPRHTHKSCLENYT